MASAFSHAAVALATGMLSTNRSMPPRFWWLSIFCSILPDADVLSFVFGIDYGSLFGHRGFIKLCSNTERHRRAAVV